MNKIEFAKLNKEQMIIAFNNLKDDYSKLFNELEEKEEQMNIMSEAFDELESQISDSIHTEHFIERLKIENLYTPVMESFIDEFMRYHNENT